MKTFTLLKNGIMESKKWKALLILVMLMCFSEINGYAAVWEASISAGKTYTLRTTSGHKFSVNGSGEYDAIGNITINISPDETNQTVEIAFRNTAYINLNGKILLQHGQLYMYVSNKTNFDNLPGNEHSPSEITLRRNSEDARIAIQNNTDDPDNCKLQMYSNYYTTGSDDNREYKPFVYTGGSVWSMQVQPDKTYKANLSTSSSNVVGNYALIRIVGGSFIGNHIELRKAWNDNGIGGAIFARPSTTDVIENGNQITIASSLNVVRISNSSIHDCYAKGSGAGIYFQDVYGSRDNQYSTLTMNNCKVYGCFSNNDSSSDMGGAIRGGVGGKVKLSMTDCDVYQNYCNSIGAGVCWAGSLDNSVTLNRCKIHENTAASNGGGLYFSTGTITSSTFYKNTSLENGGGIAIKKGKIGLAGTTVFPAGSVQYEASHISLDADTKIYGNYALNYGGGMCVEWGLISYPTKKNGNDEQYCYYYLNDDFNLTVDIDGAKIYENEAGNCGGGIYVNKSYNFGQINSGLWNDTDQGYSISNVQEALNDNPDAFGYKVNINLNYGDIYGNKSGNEDTDGNGGALYANKTGIGTFDVRIGSTNPDETLNLLGNTAENGFGGGIYIDKGNVTIKGSGTNCNIGVDKFTTETDVDDSNYGAVISINTSDDNKTGNNIAKCGGGIYVNGGDVVIEGGNMNYNTATTDGGGLYVNGGDITMKGGNVNYNTANGNGGGIYVPEYKTMKMQNECHIEYNHAGGLGGGVYMAGYFKVGENASDESGKHTLKVCNNTAGSDNNTNNVYLFHTPANTNKGFEYNKFSMVEVLSNLSKKDGDTYRTKIGISVPHDDYYNNRPIVFTDSISSIDSLLSTLMSIDANGNLNGAIFDDDMNHVVVHLDEDADDFKTKYIYFSTGWTSIVTSNPGTNDIEIGDPCIIHTAKGLAWFSSLVNGLNHRDGDDNSNQFTEPQRNLNAIVDNDINMAGAFWVPLGAVYEYTGSNFNEDNNDGYKGTFDGQGHVVSGLTCKYLTGLSKYGLFGAVDGGTVTNTFIDDYDFLAIDQTKTYNSGGVAGTMTGTATISNCEASGYTEINGCGADSKFGGIAGTLSETASIHSCMAMPEYKGAGTTMGGIAGDNKGSIKNCFSHIKFDEGTTFSNAGGLTGTNSGTVENCYVRVQGTEPTGFGWFANTNSNGTINYCYAPDGKTNYLGTDGGTLTGHGNYAGTQLDANGKYAFNHGDQAVTANNNYVRNEGSIDNDGVLSGLHATLNNWVMERDNGWDEDLNINTNGYTLWTRTMGSNINDDLPILKFDAAAFAGSMDGVFINYGQDLETLIKTYNEADNGGSIFVYGSPTTAVTADNDEDVKLYFGQDAAIKQATGNKLNARVGVTFDNTDGSVEVGGKPYDWHMFSSPLVAAPMGITYNYSDPYGYDPDLESTDIELTGQGYFPASTPIASMDFYCYSEPYYHWINFKRNSNDHWHQESVNDVHDQISYTNEETMQRGKGYMMAVDQPTILMADGTLTNSNDSIVITYTNGAMDFNGTNLIGNPYQSYLDFDAFYENTDNAKAGINIYYILDADAKGYLAYTAGASPQTQVEGTKGIASRFIHPHQGFFVKLNPTDKEQDTTANVKFTNTMRKTWADVKAENETSDFRSSRIAYPLVNLKCTDSKGYNDFSTIEINRPEQGGGEKAMHHLGNASIWSHVGDTDYQTAFTTEGTTMVPVRFKAYEDDTFTLSWNTANGDFSYLHLIDNITGTDVNCLTTDKYVFEGSTKDYLSRFKLLFDCTGVDENEDDNATVLANFAFVAGDELVVNGEGLLQMFDINGRCLMTQQLYGAQNTVGLPNVSNGIYLMRLTNNNQVKIQKMVINK